MPTQVIMPQLGESVVEGTVTRWLKNKGEQVEEYEPLLEINTDKVDSEIPSPVAGTLLEILVPPNTNVHVGELLAWIGEPGESAPKETGRASEDSGRAPGTQKLNGQTPGETAAEVSPQAEAPASAPAMQAAEAGPTPAAAERGRDLGFISPVVARIAAEHKVNLTEVPGSGQGGRITKKDILAYVEAREKAPQPAPAPQAGAPEAARAPSPQSRAAPGYPPVPAAPAQPAAPAAFPGESEDLIPHTPVRRAIAEHMVHSKHTSPHVTTVMEADLSRVVAHRQANKGDFARDGANLTFTAYFVAATVAALKAYPVVNSSWSEEGLLLHRAIHIGIAASLGEAGLIVPVIRNADGLSLLGLARAINDLSQRARSRQLKPEEVKGGTFTITNHGTSGSLFATPIINQPQCGILGVGAVQKRVVVLTNDGVDAIAIRPMVYVSLTFDHRILDGAIADTFLAKVVESLQSWA